MIYSARRFGLIVCVLIAISALGSYSGWAQSWKILPGHVPKVVNRLAVKGRLASTNELHLAIGLPLRDAAGLERFLAELYNPASTNYHQYLTPQEFADRFGPTKADYEAVRNFARANGLTIKATHVNRLVLDVTGPVPSVEKAFRIHLQKYQHPTEDRQFYAPDVEPSVDVRMPVADIQGLSDYARPQPMMLKQAMASPKPQNGTGYEGSYMGDDFRNAYVPGVNLTGAGQSVGLVEFDGYYAGDISQYAATAGGGRSSILVQPDLLDGYDGVPTTGANSGNTEVSLDIEMAMAMAPGLTEIVSFEAGPSGSPNDVFTAMVEDSSIKNLSCSWAWGGGPSATTDNLFQEMSAQGQSFFCASGDNDAYTVGANSANGVDDPNNAYTPDSSPYITLVGGTTLTMTDGGGAYNSEVVWNWGNVQGTYEGSGGGVSSYYSIPSWQAGMNMSANQGSTAQRNIPDVAIAADQINVISGNGSTSISGGTSCAAPLWAGFMALVNQEAAQTGNRSPGFINPAVYAIGRGENAAFNYAACFHDTTAGNNSSSASPSAYSAVPGYDLCTGWGTPNGMSLINALAGNAAGFSVSVASIAFTGPQGGSFAADSSTFLLTNISSVNVNWKLSTLPNWLQASATNGSISPGVTAPITISVTTNANSLGIGNYTVSLIITNMSAPTPAKATQTVSLMLQVRTGLTVLATNLFAIVEPASQPWTATSAVYTVTNIGGVAQPWALTGVAAWLHASAMSGALASGAQTNVTLSLITSAPALPVGDYKTTVSFYSGTFDFGQVPVTLTIGQLLIQNGGFESGTFAGWTQSGNTANTSVENGNYSFIHRGLYGAQLGPSSTPGYLSQTITTVPGTAYTLSLWLRNPTGQTPASFQIQWNGSTVYSLSSVANTNWTNIQVVVTASGTSSTLQFGFQDDPDFLGLDDVSLTPVPQANVQLIGRKAANFQLSWTTVAGTAYQAQYKTNLAQAEWINLGSPTAATGTTLMLTDTNALLESRERFYRLVPVGGP